MPIPLTDVARFRITGKAPNQIFRHYANERGMDHCCVAPRRSRVVIINATSGDEDEAQAESEA